MKHIKIIEKIQSGGYSRAELVKLRANAETQLLQGDLDVNAVITAIDQTSPTDKTMVFMGFCPGATMENRLDIEWKEKSICTFIFLKSPQQLDRFNSIWPGDLIILKKRQQIGKTMQLYGHGRVTGIKRDAEDNRYLEMNWSSQIEIIEVPLMGCNSTVDVKSIEQVESEMPGLFFKWLNTDQQP